MVIELDPNVFGAYFNKGLSLGYLAKYEDAIKWFDKAIELNPKDSSSWIDKDNALFNLTRYEDALSCQLQP
jgi:tetratricopeptide (TPR) repeat protein